MIEIRCAEHEGRWLVMAANPQPGDEFRAWDFDTEIEAKAFAAGMSTVLEGRLKLGKEPS